VKIRWITYISPTGGDKAFGTCIFGDYVAVVGLASPNKQYVALLRKSDGSVVREWIDSKVGALVNCISVGGKLYAIGDSFPFGVIYVFDENLDILDMKIMKKRPSNYFSLAYDGKALYIGGATGEDVDGDGRLEHVGLVEKIALDTDTLTIEKSKKIYFGLWRSGWINDIGVDPSTSRIWAVVGFYHDDSKTHSLIVILDGDLRVLRRIYYPEGSRGYLGPLSGIAFDGKQYAYVSGRDGVAKFSVDGELVAINRDSKARDKIVYGYGYLYAFGVDRIRGYDRHVLYIHDTNLNLVKSYVLSGNANTNSEFSFFFYVGRPALEGNNIYVAGFDYAPGDKDTRAVVYSLSLEGVAVKTVDEGVRGELEEGRYSLGALLRELSRK